jgi:hypothetical protein
MIDRGTVVSCFHWGKEGRPGIVLRVCPDGRLFVVVGTKSPPSPAEYVHEQADAIVVHASERYARILRLSVDTWFKKAGGKFVSPEKVSVRSSEKCPADLLRRFDKLFGLQL